MVDEDEILKLFHVIFKKTRSGLGVEGMKSGVGIQKPKRLTEARNCSKC